MTFTNLEKTIAELNSSTIDEEDGYEITSPFNFNYRPYKDHIYIWDMNEYYNIDYLENLNSLTYQCSREFGFDFVPETDDKIFRKLSNAIKKDLGMDKYIEWEDSVVMSVYF